MTPTYMTAHDIATAFDTGNERKTWTCRKFTSNDIEQVIFKVGSDLIELNYNCNTMKTEVTFKKFIASWGDYCKAITRSYYYVLHCLQRGGIPMTIPEKHDDCTIVIKLEGEARIRTFVEYAPRFKVHSVYTGRFSDQVQQMRNIDPTMMAMLHATNPLTGEIDLTASEPDMAQLKNIMEGVPNWVDTPDNPITLAPVATENDPEETQQENTDD